MIETISLESECSEDEAECGVINSELLELLNEKKKSSEELDLNSLEKSQEEHLDSFQPTHVICITCEQKIALLPDSLEHRTIKCTNCSSVLKVSCLQRISLSTQQNEPSDEIIY